MISKCLSRDAPRHITHTEEPTLCQHCATSLSMCPVRCSEGEGSLEPHCVHERSVPKSVLYVDRGAVLQQHANSGEVALRAGHVQGGA